MWYFGCWNTTCAIFVVGFLLVKHISSKGFFTTTSRRDAEEDVEDVRFRKAEREIRPGPENERAAKLKRITGFAKENPLNQIFMLFFQGCNIGIFSQASAFSARDHEIFHLGGDQTMQMCVEFEVFPLHSA